MRVLLVLMGLALLGSSTSSMIVMGMGVKWEPCDLAMASVGAAMMLVAAFAKKTPPSTVAAK